MRLGTISEAARSVGRTQPAVSSMMHTLEEELGFALFVREKGRLTATPEAFFFLDECDEILERVERSKRTLRRISTLQSGRLRIGCHPAASSVFVPRLLTGFLADKPSLEVSLITHSSEMIEDLVASLQFDIGFTETPESRSALQQSDFDLECVCLMKSNHPAAQGTTVTPEMLDGEPMAVLFDAHKTAVQTRAVFQAAGCRLNTRFELRTFASGLEFVEAGLCVMVCDMITAYSQVLNSPRAECLAIRRFRPKISNSVSILTPSYATCSLAADAFIAELEKGVVTMKHHIDEVLGLQDS